MLLVRLRLLFILLVMPILLGSLSAGYAIFMFRKFHFNPELSPIYIWIVPWITALLGGVMAAWSLATVTGRLAVRKTKEATYQRRTLRNWFATAMLGLVCFCYVVLRVWVVDTRLVMQFGYCCCCMEQPELPDTLDRVLNPLSII